MGYVSPTDSGSFMCRHRNCIAVVDPVRAARGARYCSHSCKNAAQQARHRTKHVQNVQKTVDELRIELEGMRTLNKQTDQQIRAAVNQITKLEAENKELRQRIRDSDAAYLELEMQQRRKRTTDDDAE